MINALSSAQKYYASGFFHKARPLYEKSFTEALNVGTTSEISLESIFESVSFLVRIYSEQDDLQAMSELFQTLGNSQGLFESLSGDPRYSYQLSLFYFFQNDLLNAREYNSKTVQLATDKKRWNDLTKALIQKVKIDLSFGSKGNDVAKDLEKIKVLLSEVNDADLNLIYLLLRAEVCLADKKNSESIDFVWKAYEHAKLTSCSFYYLVSSLAMLGFVYSQSGEPERAQTYLSMAEKSLIPEAMVRLGRIVKGLQAQCAGKSSRPDLLLDLGKRKLVVESGASIDFGNQFVLIDLLKLFFMNPGEVFSKEALTQRIWRQEYNPDVHDNLIYVSLKRLRSLLEKSPQVSTLIQRNRKGYYISSAIKAELLEEEQL